MPCETRFPVDPWPVSTTATTNATPSATTIASSTPTASEFVHPTIRVDMITMTAWITSSATVMTRAVLSLGAMLNNGIRHWVANALSIAGALIATLHAVTQPNIQPIFGLASLDAHWYDEPVSGMRAANCAYTRATRIWPTATTGHSQIPSGPELCRTSPYVAKIPTITDTDANEIANIWNDPSDL